MQRINKVLLLFIGLFLFGNVVNASSYTLTTIRDGKKTTTRSSDMARVSQELYDGEIVYSTAGITLNNTNRIERIYLVQDNDPNANITITVKGENKVNIIFIDGLKVTVSLYDNDSSITFNPGKYNNSTNNIDIITNGMEQSAFFSNYIYFKYDHKFNADGSIKLYKAAETTTTKITQKMTTVTRTAEVLKEDTNIAYNGDKTISIESLDGDVFESETGLYGKEVILTDVQRNKINDWLSRNDFPDIITLFDISMIGRGKELNLTGQFIIRIKIEDRLSYFEDFKIIYLDEGNDIREVIRAEVEGDYIKFPTTHLSKYGVIGTYKSATAVVKHVKKRSTIQSIILIALLSLAIGVIIYSTIKKLKSASKEAVSDEDEIVFEMFEEENVDDSNVPEVQDIKEKKEKKKKDKKKHDAGPTIGDEPIIAYAVALPEEAIAPGAISQTTDEKPKEEDKKKKKREKKKTKEEEIIATPVEEEVVATPVEEEPEVAEKIIEPRVTPKEEKKEEPKKEEKKTKPKKEEKPKDSEEDKKEKKEKDDRVQPPISFD